MKSSHPGGKVVPAPLVPPVATNPVTSHAWGKNQKMATTSWRYPWSFVTRKFHNVNQVMVATEKWTNYTPNHSLPLSFAAVSMWIWFKPLINFRACAKWFYILITILSGQYCVLLFFLPIHDILWLNLTTPVHVLLF